MANTPNKRLTVDPFKDDTGGLDLLIPKKQPLDNDSHTDENTSSPEPVGEPRERRPSKSIKNPIYDSIEINRHFRDITTPSISAKIRFNSFPFTASNPF